MKKGLNAFVRRVAMVLGLVVILVSCSSTQSTSLYDFTVADIDGVEFDLSSLKGKKVMIVNTASACGLTPQYEQLQALYDKYKDSGFVIVGFPANNFADQESGTNEEIKAFCSANFDVSFPMMSKISVVGEDMAPLYKWLTSQVENGVGDFPVEWNFQKFLINEDGSLHTSIEPRTLPNAPEVIEWIEEQN